MARHRAGGRRTWGERHPLSLLQQRARRGIVTLADANRLFMKPLEKDELFQNLSEFLKRKGIELKQGSYAQGIQKGCTLLTGTVNAGRRGLECAKAGFDKKLDRMRQVIHEKTAPKAAAAPSPPEPPPQAAASPSPSQS